MKRKEFLQISSLGLGAALMPNLLLGKAFDLEEIKKKKQFDVIIIGTGYGAAVTAHRLAQKGVKCLMLEMGLDWENSEHKFSKMIFPHKESTWLRTKTVAPFGNIFSISKFTGVLDRLDYENVNVYVGRGVGGGSLANGGMAVVPKRSYFEEIFPELDADKFYSKYFPLVKKELGVQIIPKDYFESSEYHEYARIGKKEAEYAGYKTQFIPNIYDFEYMRKEEKGEVEKSALGHEVIYGNNHGKKDLTKNYLKWALDSGNVSILQLHKATEIFQNKDQSYSISVEILDTKGEVVGRKVYRTNKLFLGAGSTGTTELLLKSKTKGSIKSDIQDLGKYWGNNGNTMAARTKIWETREGKQSSIPIVAIDNWSDSPDAFFTEIAPFPIGIDNKVELYLLINRLKKYGEFKYDLKKNQMTLDWDRSHTTNMVLNTDRFLDRMNLINGGKPADFLLKRGIGENICYHPLGGCVIGKSTDKYGRVKGAKNLYVTDGALIPGTVGVNPFLTITALAEYCIEHIIKQDFKKIERNKVESNTVDFSILPSSEKGDLSVKLNLDKETQCTFYIYKGDDKNYLDNLIKQGNFKCSRGISEYKLTNISDFQKGNYKLRVETGYFNFSDKFSFPE